MKAYLLAAAIAALPAGPASADASSDDLANRLGVAGPSDYRIDCRNIAHEASYDAFERDQGAAQDKLDALLVRMDQSFAGAPYNLKHQMDTRTAIYRFMLQDIYAHPALTPRMAADWAAKNCNWYRIDSSAG